MINRILIKTHWTNYIHYDCKCSYVTFDGLSAKTKLRLIELGWHPATLISHDGTLFYRLGNQFYYKHDWEKWPAYDR